MSARKPLVLDNSANMQQLQAGDEADIPLDARFQAHEQLFRELLFVLNEQRIALTPALLEELQKYDR